MRGSKCSPKRARTLATVELPYLKGNSKSPTSRAGPSIPTGRSIPLTVKPEDLMVSKSGDTAGSTRRSLLCPAWRSAASWSTATTCATTTTILRRRSGRSSGLISSTRRITQFTPFKAVHAQWHADSGHATCIWCDSRGRMVSSLIWWQRLPPGVKMQTSVNGSYTRGCDRRSAYSRRRVHAAHPELSLQGGLFLLAMPVTRPPTGQAKSSSGRRMSTNSPSHPRPSTTP